MTFAGEELFPKLEHAWLVLRMNPVNELLVLNFGEGVAGEFLDGRIDVNGPALHIEGKDDIGRVLGD